MVTDEMLKRAIEAYAKDTGAEDWVLEGWIEPAIRASLEAALSAAEPVVWVYAPDLAKGYGGFGKEKGSVVMSLNGEWINVDTPLYASPPATAISSAELVTSRNDEAGYVEFLNEDVPYVVRDIQGSVAILLDLETRNVIGYRVYDPDSVFAPPAPSVAVKALEGAFKHFKVVYDPPNGISINEATRAEAIKLAASALYATLSQAEIETLRACEDWKATFEIMRIRRVDKAAEAWRSSQKIVDNLLDRGLLEFGEPNTTYRITDAGRSALSAQVQDARSDDDEETYQIGVRDGYSQAVQEIDRLTGGDGEYRYCTDHDPERHTPGPAEMIQRIVDRFETLNLIGDAEKRGDFWDAPGSAQVQDVAGWRPIETAPKDKDILLALNHEDGWSYVAQGRWVDGEEDQVDQPGHDAGFVDCDYQCFFPGRSFGSDTSRYEGKQPTHWMPLPAAPAKQEGGHD